MGIPWDGTGINCYGMGQISMSHGQPVNRPCLLHWSMNSSSSFSAKEVRSIYMGSEFFKNRNT